MEKKKSICPIISRIYYALRIELSSPLCISGGQSETTDADVLVNGSGEVFVPGTSLAGAMRNYLELDKKKEGLFGYSDGEKGRMSSVFISDMYFGAEMPKEEMEDEDCTEEASVDKDCTKEGPEDGDCAKKAPEDKGCKAAVVSVRDGVQLTKDKTVNNKFDMEIVETGAEGLLFLNLLIRENESAEKSEENIGMIFQGIESGEIRIGANKNRGFGRLHIKKIYRKEFCPGSEKFDISEWISFKKNFRDLSLYAEKKTFDEWSEESKGRLCQKYVRIYVPLRLTGGISIRRYSAIPAKADFEHLTCNGNPVIPGTSWNGAIRSDARNILISLGMTEGKADETIRKWFGMVKIDSDKQGKTDNISGSAEQKKTDNDIPEKTDSNEQKKTDNNVAAAEQKKLDADAFQSRVVIGESVLTGSVRVPMTRNRISRFDASTINGALYSEMAYFGGRTGLEILVRKDEPEKEENHAYKALIAVLNMVIQDIAGGYVAVGGQTAVGRGIFAADGEPEIAYSEDISVDSCMSELYSLL